MSFLDYKRELLKLNEHREHTLKNSWGAFDVYRWLSHNKWFNIGKPISSHDFYLIIRTMNTLLVEDFIKGNDIKLPHKMGIIELRKYEPKVLIENNKVKSQYFIDWDSTLKLWYTDKEAKSNKTLLKHLNKEVFKIIYNRAKANYPNQVYYEFRPTRALKKKVKEAAKNEEIDAFKLE